jgi:molybdate transport system substrate-binding protein
MAAMSAEPAHVAAPLRGISSKATQSVLAELARRHAAATGQAVAIESVGGVDAARRVAAGEAFDVVLLAAEALDALIAQGHLRPGRVDLARSPVAAAVRAGAPVPRIDSAEALRAALQAASTIGYSTGPSGTHLLRLFERWGLAETVAAKTVQAPPGVPVGRLVAEGRVALGFQQLSELIALPGLTLLGPLPPEAAHVTTFSAALGAGTAEAHAAAALLRFFTSAEAGAVWRTHGMEPATETP